MIEFANPAALWFLALIIPVVLLYLLKRRRLDRIVPSILLWKQAVEDTQASTPFQKLRSNLLLLLQILIVVLLTALLAKPYFSTPTSQSRQWILVLDRSASMQARDEKPTRFEVACNKLTGMLDSIAPTDEVMLITLGSEASILQNFTLNHDAIRQKLNEVETQDIAADWERLSLIVKPLFKKSPRPKLIIASDFANLSSGTVQNMNFDSIRVGGKVDNLAVTGAAIEPLSESTREQFLFVRVQNFSDTTRLADVRILKNNELLDAFELEMKPMEEIDKTVKVPVLSSSRFEVRVEPEDLFPLDNDFILIAAPREKTAVHAQIENPFLRRALQVLPAVEIKANARIKISSRLQDSPGIYFLGGNHRSTAEIVQWNSSAPALRFVDAGLWRISNYQVMELPSGATTLLETTEGVVGYAQVVAGNPRIVLGFPVEESNLPLLAGFPIFIGNGVDWIREGIDPKQPTQTNRDFPQEGETKDGMSYVNFANAAESELTPQQMKAQSVSETRASILRQDFSKWFLLVLLAIVMLEWWVFHRKQFV
jgi:Ca-activated chloride channel homolog